MATFKHFLLEQEGRTREIDYNEALRFVVENCREYVMFADRIYRGMGTRGTNGNIFFGDPSTQSPRTSANTSNEYTLLIDNLPNWKNYPKRSESFICSNTKHTATGYGIPFVAFPPDNTNIAIAPREDIWFSFRTLPTNFAIMDDFNEALALIITKILGEKSQDQNWSEFKDQLLRLQRMLVDNGDEILYKQELNNDAQQILQWFRKNNYKVLETLAEMLDPKKNGFDMQKAKRFNLDENKDRELWLSAQVVFVRAQHAESFIENALNQINR